MLWRVVPLIGLLFFLGLGFGWRTWFQARRYGGSGVVLFRSGRGEQTLREALGVLLVVVMTAEAVTAAAAPTALAALGTVLPPDAAETGRPLGAVLLFGATALMVVAQTDLGASWRIGIEEAARPGLVTGGLYRLCRNPIFLFMLIGFAGFTLLLPNWLSLAMLAGAVVGVRRQVVEEEVYLLRTYPDEYRAYARRVGRFVPGIGRLG